MATEGQLVCTTGGSMAYKPSNGMLIYFVQQSIDIEITISWAEGDDLDIACFWTNAPSMIVGWHHSNSREWYTEGKYQLYWDGDNTGGGPEYVKAKYNEAADCGSQTLQIRANWYRTGEDKPGGLVTITSGSFSKSFVASSNKGQPATVNDPGVIISFNTNGTIKAIQ